MKLIVWVYPEGTDTRSTNLSLHTTSIQPAYLGYKYNNCFVMGWSEINALNLFWIMYVLRYMIFYSGLPGGHFVNKWIYPCSIHKLRLRFMTKVPRGSFSLWSLMFLFSWVTKQSTNIQWINIKGCQFPDRPNNTNK